MRGADKAVADQRADKIAVLLLKRQINFRRCAAELEEIACVNALAQMAACIANQHQRIALLQPIGRRAAFEIVDDADRADGRRWQNGLAVGLVIERDIAADDREREFATGFRHPVDRTHDLAHDFRALRITEIEIVRHRERARARHS